MASISNLFDPELEKAIETLSTQARLLIASDFDGTLASFTCNPADTELDAVTRVSLRKLSELPNTYVTVISGRALRDLRQKFPGLDRLRLIGSHGHEFDLDQLAHITDEQKNLLSDTENIVRDFVEQSPGTRIEVKPHGVVFHYRGVSPEPLNAVKNLRAQLVALGAGIVRDSNMALEFSVVPTNKGDALNRLREQITPSMVLFIGDDLTDESAFDVIGVSDVSIKIGPGQSSAHLRVEGPAQAAQFLARLADRRAEWINTAAGAPIEDHLFLSDLRTAALVDGTGSINWFCAPRFDSAPLFGALVGGPAAGHFRISGNGPGHSEYVDQTMVGKTIFGELSVTDFLDCSGGRSYQRAGRTDLIRIVEGSGSVSVEFAPKSNFGRVPTRLSGVSNGLRIECGQLPLVLYSPGWNWEIVREGMHDVARSTRVFNHEKAALILLVGTASPNPPAQTAESMLTETQRFWQAWLTRFKLPQVGAQLVVRSALVLRGLSYGPTGAIVAAATTSIPETIGGVRNWDYRYCWPRDASLAASALVRIGSPGLAMRLLDWLLAIELDSGSENFLAPLYTVTGRSVPSEAEVPEALGYYGSRPVRTGNLASEQLQLDTLGPIAELMLRLAQNGLSLTSEHLEFAQRLVSLVQARWNDPDSGIWELRGARRHFVHSKLMCWYTVYCCIEVARYLGDGRSEWEDLAAAIRTQIEQEGYDETLQSYVSAYDLHAPDAALVWVVLSGFHPPDHPRSEGTLDYIMKNLVHDGGVFRYHFDDVIPGHEGEFIICRTWLIEALAMAGKHGEARQLFDEFIKRIGPAGLVSEQWDTARNCALGNFPQAYSHLGLINAACALSASAAQKKP